MAVKPIVDLETNLAKIIADNRLAPARDDAKVVGVMRQLNLMQKQLGSYNHASGHKVASMLAETKENILREVGGVISEEVNQLLKDFAASYESIEAHFERLSGKMDQ